MTPNDPIDALERLIDRTLDHLPLRRAPSSLEARVLSALEKRAGLSWWRRSFAHWPPLARMAFLVTCSALIGLAMVASATASAGIHSLAWAHQIGALVVTANSLATLLTRIAPPAWVYQGIAACAVLYAFLFGLGAALYRTLYLQSVDGR